MSDSISGVTGVLWLVAVLMPNALLSAETASQHDLTPELVYATASPFVVQIVTEDDLGNTNGKGSGFIVGHRDIATNTEYLAGVVATNYHVIRSAVRAEARFSDGSTAKVLAVIGENDKADVALVTVLKRPPSYLGMDLNSTPLIGSRVFAIGSPLGLTNTLSEGIVSGYRRLGSSGQQWLQITAPISPGSSGGAVLSAQGKVIGMTTASLSGGQNLNFAVPATEIQRLLDTPGQSRALWKGTSILEEKNQALAQICQEFVDTWKPEDKAAYWEARANGDTAAEDSIWTRNIPEKLASCDLAVLILKADTVRRDEGIKILRYAIERSGKSKPRETASNKSKVVGLSTSLAHSPSDDYLYLAYFRLGEFHFCESMSQKTKGRKYEKQAEEAIEAFTKAAGLNPGFSPAFNMAALLHGTLGRHREALGAAETLVRLVPRCSEAYRQRGDILLALERPEAAVKDFLESIDLVPRSLLSYLGAADAYRKMRDYEKAVAILRAGLELMPDQGILYRQLGSIYVDMGKDEQALSAFEEAESLESGK